MDGERMNNAGWYKIEDDTLLYGSNIIESSKYLLISEEKDKYNLPIDGWYWFDNEQEARIFFKLDT